MKNLIAAMTLLISVSALADTRCNKAAVTKALADYASEVTSPYCAVTAKDAVVFFTDEENNLLRDQNGRTYLGVSIIPGNNILCGSGLDFYYYYSIGTDGKCQVSGN